MADFYEYHKPSRFIKVWELLISSTTIYKLFEENAAK
jgi:hypothetical protein